MKHYHDALKRFITHYRQTFAAWWDIRHQLDPVPRRQDELAFLPAHLELTDTPLSPLPYWSMRLIGVLFLIMLLWACIGQLDIVAMAGGKTVSGGRTKVIQPLEPAVVKAIYVKDGQQVAAGQLLIELDGTAANADHSKADEAFNVAVLTAARYQALLASLETGQLPHLDRIAGVGKLQLSGEETLAIGMWRAYLAKRDALQATLLQRQAELASTKQQIIKLQGSSRLARQKEKDYLELLEVNAVSKHAMMEKQQTRIELEGDLASQQNRAQELAASLQNQQQELAALGADFRSDALSKRRDALDQITLYREELKKTAQRKSQTRLTAPVSGSVQQLAIHTVGGVVTEAQPLLAIVPANDPLEVEVQIENKDIGFVRVGQLVAVKVESFPYTRYGYLDGVVETVSHDAMQDEKKGLVFLARIRLNQHHLVIDGTRVNLVAGMTVTAEINTGKRRVISYFLSPLQEHVGQSLKER